MQLPRKEVSRDREAAEQVIAAIPSIRTGVRANRAFLARAVHYLTAEEGIRQFLDVGTGLPAANNTHEVAQRAAPKCRIVYVDNDPVVLTHAQALLTSSPEGRTAYIHADLRHPEKILHEAPTVLDLARPVAVMLVGILHLIRDEENPYGIVADLMDNMASGSYLVISHITADLETDQMVEAQKRYNQRVVTPQTLRSHAEVVRFFDGLQLLEPGVVQVHRWRAGEGNVGRHLDIANYAGVGRKP